MGYGSRNKDPVELVEAFIERSQQTTDLDDLRLIAESTFKSLGFRYFACASHVDPLKPRGTIMVLNYPKRWVQIFSKREYHLIDPVFTYAAHVFRPFHWDDPQFRAQLTAAQRAIMAHARQFEIDHGYTIPCCLPVLRGSQEVTLMSSCSLVPYQRGLPPVNYMAATAIAGDLFVAVARLQGIKLSAPAMPTHLRAAAKVTDARPSPERSIIPARIDPPGLYSISLHAAMGRKLFTSEDDYTHFEKQLAATLERTGAEVLAYCWLPRSIDFILRTRDVPPARILQGLMSAYIRWLHAHSRESGPQLTTQHTKFQVNADSFLLMLVRNIHYRPVDSGFTRDYDSYPHSSHQAYLGRKQIPWLTMDRVWRALGSLNDAEAVYDDLMSDMSTWTDVPYFKSILVKDARPVDQDALPTDLLPNRAQPDPHLTIDTIVTAVLTLLKVAREDLFSKSRRRSVTLARTLIAWHVQELGIATLAQVARHLGRTPSSISHLIAHHRPLRPELFKPDVLIDVLPLPESLESHSKPPGSS